jgi:hypothetical protein
MGETVNGHLARLRLVSCAMLVSTGIYGAVVQFVPPPGNLPLAQGQQLVWIFALLALVNLVTLTPVYRAMMAGPRQAYDESHETSPLLAAGLRAHLVMLTRLEATAVVGLVVYFLTADAIWFWPFNIVAAAGIVLLWPRRDSVVGLLGDEAATGQPSIS